MSSAQAVARVYHKACHRLRSIGARIMSTLVRKPLWRLQGMTVGRGTMLTSLDVNWPHKVAIGDRCVLEPDIFFKFDGIWSPGRAIVIGDATFIGRGTEFNVRERVEIGEHALISSGCKFIDHNHGIAPGSLMGPQQPSPAPITVGRGAWLGANVVVLQGVSIGDGAVVGAGAVVNRSAPANEIWGGVPARRLGSRSELAELHAVAEHSR